MGYLRGGPLWFPASKMLGLPLVILPGPPLKPALANLTAPPSLRLPRGPPARLSPHSLSGCPLGGPRRLASGAQNSHQDPRRETDEAAELRRWQNRPSGYQETGPWWRQEWAECRGMRPTPGKKCQSATTGTAHTRHWQKMTPICVTSLTLTAWKSRWNPSKNWVSMEPACARWGPPSLAWQSTRW